MSRVILPNRRSKFTADFIYGQSAFHVSFAVLDFESFRVSEIFLATAKTSSDLEALARDAMIVASFALQHGATIAELKAGMTRDTVERAASVIGHALDVVSAMVDDLKRHQCEVPHGDA